MDSVDNKFMQNEHEHNEIKISIELLKGTLSTFKGALDNMKNKIIDTKFENRIFTAILGLMLTVIIFLFTILIKYQKLSYNAQISRYDYNHEIDSTLNSVSKAIDYFSKAAITINKMQINDSLFYNVEFKNLKHSVSDNKHKIDNLASDVTILKSKL